MAAPSKFKTKKAGSPDLMKKIGAVNLAKESTLKYIIERNARAKRLKHVAAKTVKVTVKKQKTESVGSKYIFETFLVDNDRVAAFDGIEFEDFRSFVDKIEMSQEDLYQVFGLSESTYHRRRAGKMAFVGQEADVIIRVAEIYRYAEDVFENPQKAHSWMKSPRKYLSGKRPVDLLSSSVGIEAVKSYLGRIDHGIFA